VRTFNELRSSGQSLAQGESASPGVGVEIYPSCGAAIEIVW